MRSCVGPLERQVLELVLDGENAQTVSQRGVNGQRLFGKAGLLRRRRRVQITHLDQPGGELDDHHACIRHGQDHGSKLRALVVLQVTRRCAVKLGHAMQARDALHQFNQVFRKLDAQIVNRGTRHVQSIVQQADSDGFRIHAELGERNGNVHALVKMRPETRTGVRLGGEFKRFANRRLGKDFRHRRQRTTVCIAIERVVPKLPSELRA
mmetsp:Transcript_7792/g.17494  ORF Transcript_7792/g.17494 Transcript_7792/m.17494 type:complete len:209 (-) Transcript_7792:852-1478(-)